MSHNTLLAGLLAAAGLVHALPAGAHSNVAYADGQARFTVIADGTVRMEWNPGGRFLDAPSLLAVNRDYPEVRYTVREAGDSLTVETSRFRLHYVKGSGRFTRDNLSVDVLANGTTWRPGDVQLNNLKGTTRTLDGLDGDIQTQTWCADMKPGERRVLDDGLLATDGWTLLDDSDNYIFDGSADWNWVADREDTDVQDWYFMAYGHDYKSALREYTLFAGRIPLPPRYAFGYWWSRYWAYSDRELRALADKFDAYGIPFDVVVVDMDWHYTDEGRGGWTGWTWNRSLFPDPAGFADAMHDRGVKVTVNIHPADGFEPYEQVYPALAARLGRRDGRKIDWVNSDKAMMTAAFDSVFHPMQRDGIDFWWLDWQQAINDPVKKNLDNTWWINYCFFSDMERNGTRRPLLYHRWGGLGNHRYQVGFSGDAVISWKSLDYQPYFTSTASNVLYGYWSHDIGGHLDTGSGIDPEMYVRWLQFGAVSPVMRTHSSKNSALNKEPWVFADEYRDIIRNTVRQRYAMVPYIYTMARKAHDTGLSLCRPMYYDWPEAPEAYAFSRQYMFGDDVLIAPVTVPGTDGYASVDVWLPEGQWYELHSGTLLDGARTLTRRFGLDEYGIYVKAGSVLPMYGPDVRRLDGNAGAVTLTVFPGADGSFEMYEDAGDDKSYRTEYATTRIKSERTPSGTRITVEPRQGAYEGMPATRPMSVRLLCAEAPLAVTVDGVPAPWSYDGTEFAVVADLGDVDCSVAHVVEIAHRGGTSLADGTIGLARRAGNAVNYIKFNGCDTHIDELAALGTLAEAAGYRPAAAPAAAAAFRSAWNRLPDILRRQGMSDEVAARFLKKTDWAATQQAR